MKYQFQNKTCTFNKYGHLSNIMKTLTTKTPPKPCYINILGINIMSNFFQKIDNLFSFFAFNVLLYSWFKKVR